ncbi:SDR family NAD(P)-dependent oxidoreductase [Magnetovibrio blakemorei]|uniref:Oxidoreductase n=1 Tax=Magnetovibrio blakemorei TaxID=28181 RepID=A0A1E5QAM5_9PROT|nr:SDR family NAD(P)-dependent oxidoreductase [Magnetovibrio blakemorei]OEJ68470.1 oxidoreductase [Magnetovibrio blakemorei]
MADKILEGRVALITGASRGIGRALAQCFAEQGAHLILTARTQGALEELDDELRGQGFQAPTLVPCDLTDFDTIDKIGGAIYERFKKLDVLIGNAGTLGTLAPITHIDPKEWQRVLDINLTANWRLLRSMDPLLKASDAGRVVFATSSVGHQPRAYWGTYAVSKAALEMVAGIYAQECAKTNVKVNLINPGATRTDMRAIAMPGEVPETVKAPETINHLFLELASPACTVSGTLVEAEQELQAGHTTYSL